MRLMVSVLTATLLLLGGCQTLLAPNQYEMRISSIPSGALIYAPSGRAIGMTPFEGLMTLSPQQAQSDSLIDEALLVWPSGATTRQKITIRPRENRIWNVTIFRPSGAPNLEADLRHASAQARTQSSPGMDVSALLTSFAASYAEGRYQQVAPSISPPTSVRCITRNSGWAVVTDCR